MALAAIVLCVMASANDLMLRYDRPAQFFEEALVIGNGNIGATVYGGINRERISLNDITLWTGEPETGVTTPGASSRIPEIRRAIDRGDFRAADSLNMFVQGHYSENYQPLGNLNITFNGIDSAAVTGYNRSLSLNDAVARSTFTIGNLRHANLSNPRHGHPSFQQHLPSCNHISFILSHTQITPVAQPHKRINRACQNSVLSDTPRLLQMLSLTSILSSVFQLHGARYIILERLCLHQP